MLRGPAGAQAAAIRRLGEAMVARGPWDLVVLGSILLSGLAPTLRETLAAPVIAWAGGEEGFLDHLGGEWSGRCWAQVDANLHAIDRCLAMSGFAQRRLAPRLALPAARWEVVVPGIDPDGYGPPRDPAAPPVLGFLAHLAPLKGLHIVVDAFRRLHADGVCPELRLAVAGACSFADRGYLRQQQRCLAAAGLADRCTFLINPDGAEKRAFLGACTVLAVCPTYPEAYGLYLLEAAAAGVPVVVPARGALPEVGDELGGCTCYAVDPAADPDPHEGARLACALAAVLQDPAAAAARAARAGAIVRRDHDGGAVARRVLAAAVIARRRQVEERTMNEPLIRLEAVTRTFGGDGAPYQTVLAAVDLELAAGASVGIVGPSGAGKSTLLNLLGALDAPTSGRVRFGGTDLATLDERGLAALRNRRIGFIFQDHHLLPQCTVRENILLPTLALAGGTTPEQRRQADELLARVGLANRGDDWPRHLSGGERQRVAVIRALINRPDLVLADEPTGALDRASAATLADLLLELQRDLGTALVVVTHQLDLARRLDRVLEMRDGRLTEV
jgi:lipoprotein-releasing system ATP-binding protein